MWRSARRRHRAQKSPARRWWTRGEALDAWKAVKDAVNAENKVAIAELLLKHNPGCVDALKGRTDRSSALHIAADFGYQETCRVLIAAGADVSLTNGQQMTAIHLAARNRSEPVLRLLLTRSSNINTGLVNARVSLSYSFTLVTCCLRTPTVELPCLFARQVKAPEQRTA